MRRRRKADLCLRVVEDVEGRVVIVGVVESYRLTRVSYIGEVDNLPLWSVLAPDAYGPVGLWQALTQLAGGGEVGKGRGDGGTLLLDLVVGHPDVLGQEGARLEVKWTPSEAGPVVSLFPADVEDVVVRLASGELGDGAVAVDWRVSLLL